MHFRLSKTLLAFVLTLQVINAANVCQSDPYKDLLFLSKYQIAEAYCSSYYPVAPVTTTVGGGKMKRNQATSTTLKTTTTTKKTTTTTPKMTTTTKSTSTTANSCTGNCASWTSCTKKGGAFVSTLCSCIETPKTVTITATTTTTKAKTTTTTTTKPTTTTTTTTKPTTTTTTTTTPTATTTTTVPTTTTTTTTTTPPTTTTTTTESTTTTTTTEVPVPTQCSTSRYIEGTSACACGYYATCDTAITGTVLEVFGGLTLDECALQASTYRPIPPAFNFDPVTMAITVCTILSTVTGTVPAPGQFAGTYVQGI